MNRKKVNVANFNVVFLEEKYEAPLLKYFDTIVMPALTEGIRKKNKDSELFFMNIRVEKVINSEYALVGNIVKKTVIEIKSDLEDGKLVEKDEHYPAAPYSTFVIYLNNHRMLYVRNQKGSPDLRSFVGLVKYVFAEYIKKYNEEIDNRESYLPFPCVNVVGIPMHKNVEEILKTVKRVSSLTLRFYPLNGDLDFGGLYGNLMRDMRTKSNSDSESIVLKRPSNFNGIVEIIENSNGTCEAEMQVIYLNKSKGKITQDQISENMEMDFSEDNIEDVSEVLEQGKKLNSIAYTTKEHQDIYDKYLSKVLKFFG